MITDKEILDILIEFNSIKPLSFLQKIDIQGMGIGNVLGFLLRSEGPVSAGEISEYMNVSTARVAVLIKKMAEKGLITRETDPEDRRRVMCSITPSGRGVLEEKEKEILLYSRAVIEHFGTDRVQEFIESCREIKSVVEKVEEQEKKAGASKKSTAKKTSDKKSSNSKKTKK
ncbi:MAG: MarR family transcriptional regulator [Clostridiales bacterium]|nr:MarR family transcriptional regulator [Clostridiales bacterium]